MGVRWETDGPVVVVTIDRPEIRNAVDPPTAAELLERFVGFDADPSLSVAVLTGAGGSFCAGFDLKALARGEPFHLEDDRASPMGPARLRLDKPVIAAVEGFAVGGGFELALWCDLRVAARDAVFGIYNRRFGVPCVDGGSVRLPRLLGASRALDLLLTGRPVPAEEAFAIGLANRLSEPGRARDDAVAMAHELAAFPQAALRGDRRSALDQWGLPEAEALGNELRLGRPAMESGEAAAGASRFAEGAGRHGSRQA